MDDIILNSDPVTSQGELFVRVTVVRGTTRIVDRMVAVNNTDAVITLVEEIAQATGKDLSTVEQQLAEHISRARAWWMRRLAGESGYKPNFTTSAQLAALTERPRWLIKKVLVRDQPAIFGGPKKAMKTSLLIDAAVSLGSGKRFLNWFDVPERVNVAVLSGESGQWAIKDTAERVAKAKGVSLADCSVLWGFDLPRVSFDPDLSALGAALRDNKVAVAFVDPAYLCLLAGNSDVQASNVFQVGPLLMRLSRTCQDAGATLVLVHHAGKVAGMQRVADGEPMELEDLAYAGFQEFARQWLLINRRLKYEPGSGRHHLWLNVGGSAGHSGLWGVDVDEGQLRDDFGGRRWQVEVFTAEAAKQVDAVEKDKKKSAANQAKADEQRRKVEEALLSVPAGETARAIAEAAGLQRRLVGPILTQMVNRGLVQPVSIEKLAGRSTRMYDGFRLALDSRRVVEQVEARVVAARQEAREAKRVEAAQERAEIGEDAPAPFQGAPVPSGARASAEVGIDAVIGSAGRL